MEKIKAYKVAWKLVGVFCVLTVVITLVLLSSPASIAGN